MGGWWDDFSNNLATDLSPFVTLFGEAPTKQYLSECLSLVDAVIFGIAPLGVITAVVSAVRVTGPPSLRAFIGRAQEGSGSAEAELCSSTSREVCELYTNGGGIARVLGHPKLLEIVHDQHIFGHDFFRCEFEPAAAGIYPFKHFIYRSEEWIEEGRRKTEVEPDAEAEEQLNERKLSFAPNPNLTLNIGIRFYPTRLLVITAGVGVSLQLGILIWAGIARYRLGWTRGDFQDRYGVPVLVIGTALLSTGMVRCAQLVEGSTKERVFSRSSSSTATSRLYWIQPGTQFIGDQAFDSFAYSHPSNQFNRYITSWKDSRVPPKTLALGVALGFTVMGFALQFLGLRGCHSTVAVAQLALTLLMSMVRSWLRSSRLAERDVCLADCPELYAGRELDWLALYIGHIDLPRCQRKWMVSPWRSYQNVESVTSRLEESRLIHTYFGNEETAVLSGFGADNIAGWPNLVSKQAHVWEVPERWRFRHLIQSINDRPGMEETGAAFLYRARLAQLTRDWDDQLVRVRAVARSLARAIEATANLLFTADGIVLEDGWDALFVIYWAVPCETTTDSVCPSSHIPPGNEVVKPLYLSLRRSVDGDGQVSGEWSVDALELEAMLGLWAWSVTSSCKLSSYDQFCRVAWIGGTSRYTDEFHSWGWDRFDRWGGSLGTLLDLPDDHRDDPTVFGWHHIPAQTVSDIEFVSFRIPAGSWPTLCAQELFSIFFASILHIVRDLGGATTESGAGEIRNTNITQIQKAFTDNGLGSISDVMACIFPALKNQGKLPQVRRNSDQGP
ncbi:hypothetical protein IFM58399_06570 [Aspergillus lentulus]|uniref:uncharacterized protein n=1 Tax=Aspergillus lentulus TaxID=293939 RepID=UPI001394B5E4|nr:uncharacterized protein IFM58399_06570 [Aspergillus lentulus]GFF42323.1 hypothetical protein IFM58399_06570 [Aspergillus lentulus]